MMTERKRKRLRVPAPAPKRAGRHRTQTAKAARSPLQREKKGESQKAGECGGGSRSRRVRVTRGREEARKRKDRAVHSIYQRCLHRYAKDGRQTAEKQADDDRIQIAVSRHNNEQFNTMRNTIINQAIIKHK